MNLTSPACPGTPIATLQPFRSLRSRKVSSASRTSCSGSASGWLRILGYSTKSNASATTWSGVSPGTSFRALSAAWPTSSAQTAWIFAMRSYSCSAQRATERRVPRESVYRAVLLLIRSSQGRGGLERGREGVESLRTAAVRWAFECERITLAQGSAGRQRTEDRRRTRSTIEPFRRSPSRGVPPALDLNTLDARRARKVPKPPSVSSRDWTPFEKGRPTSVFPGDRSTLSYDPARGEVWARMSGKRRAECGFSGLAGWPSSASLVSSRPSAWRPGLAGRAGRARAAISRLMGPCRHG